MGLTGGGGREVDNINFIFINIYKLLYLCYINSVYMLYYLGLKIFLT